MDTTQIINTLLPIIQNVIGGLMKYSGSGMMGTARELKAIVEFAGEAATQYGDDPVMSGLLEQLQGNFMDDVNIEAIDANAVLAGINGLDSLLPPHIAATVKPFIYELAERVANAAGTGLFGTGEKVTGTEAQYLEILRTQLGL
jgi:hypothetical protein